MDSIYLSSNIEKMEKYPYYFGPDIYTLAKSYSRKKNMDMAKEKICNNPQKNIRVLIANITDIRYLFKIETLSRKDHAVTFKKVPFYLYYETYDTFLDMITINDITPLLESRRVVFLIGETYLKEYFKDLQTVLPTAVYGYNYCQLERLIEKITFQREKKLEQIHKEIVEYYEINNQRIVNNILSGKPKILFVKCRFSYVIKNHTRDCCEAFKRLGYETVVSEETADINRIYREADINKYKPDIIFDIDHFRYNYNFQLPNVVYITWIEDLYPRLLNSDITTRITKRDIILNFYVSFKEIYNKYGFKKEDLIDAPVPCNEQLYKKYKLNSKEIDKYSCDICYVSNINNFKKVTDECIIKYKENIQNSILKFIAWYYEKEYNQTFIHGYQPDILYNYFSSFIDKSILLSNNEVQNIIYDLIQIQYSIKKYITAQWITQMEGLNINLWGNDWNEMDEFKQYSKGEAKNGEELSKIYNASKICIGTHPTTTSSIRVFEILSSGAFCIQLDIGEEADISSFKTLVKGDTKGLVFYNTKEELFEKINYYIQAEKERCEISEYGYNQVRKNFTFIALVKKVMNKIIDRLKDMN